MDDKQSTSQGQRLLQALVSEGHYIFDTELAKNVAKRLAIPSSYFLRLLSSLVKKGWLIRLRRGLYAGTGQLPGQFDISPFAIATHLVSPAAISHWSALHHHGFTEQIPKRVTAMTPKKINQPIQSASKKIKATHKHLREIAGIYYEYIYVKPEKFFGIEKIWLDEYFCVPITDKERTILEIFASIRYFGGTGEIFGIIESSLDELDLDKLITYTLCYNSAATIKRLGWVLEYFGVKQSLLKPLLNYPIKGYRLLDPTKPKRGRYNKCWMLLDNVTKGDI